MNEFASVSASASVSWRSQGWRPLTFPVFHSLFESFNPFSTIHLDLHNYNKDSLSFSDNRNVKVNLFFPLHRDVLLAAIRELILLNDHVSSSPVKRKSKIKMTKIHGNSIINLQNSTNNNQSPITKEEEEVPIMSFTQDPEAFLRYCERRANEMLESCNWYTNTRSNMNLITSTQPLAKSDLQHERRSFPSLMPTSSLSENPSSMDRSIRKVSDAEEDEDNEEAADDDDTITAMSWTSPVKLDKIDPYEYSNPHYAILANDPKGREIVRQCLLTSPIHPLEGRDHHHRHELHQEAFLRLYSAFPPFVNMSIAMEEYMRQVVFDMISPMLLHHVSFATLKAFFGYKSKNISHHVLIEMMADLLFDVSHALVSPISVFVQ